jgi:hypothetical protein
MLDAVWEVRIGYFKNLLKVVSGQSSAQEHFPLSFSELLDLSAHPHCNTVHLQYQKCWMHDYYLIEGS